MGEHILYAQENGFSPPVLSLGVLSGEGGFWSLLRISVIIHCDPVNSDYRFGSWFLG